MKAILAIVCVALVALVGFGAVYAMTTNVSTGASEIATLSSASNALSVSIAGEVNMPGTYVLNNGSTLLDLINAAQGTTGNADALAFNTDYVLESAQTYYIAPLFDNANSCSAAPIVKTNVNADDSDTMQAVAGFTKTVANAIVSYRSTGTFKAIEDIKKVSGIGAATYEKVKSKITLRSA